jgi:hypothetical protein
MISQQLDVASELPQSICDFPRHALVAKEA